ncbi:MAG: arsenate reductase ArsC [Acidobacteriaceae bacterium]
MKRRVLFLCTGNSARSQMAEGWLRHLAGDQFHVFSAGTHPSRVNPFAIAAMREVGADISSHTSKSLDLYRDQPFDYVITVCDRARESCPYFPGAFEAFHWSLEDPAEAPGTDDDKLAAFRRIRDQIHDKIANEFLCLCRDRQI